ncbi:NADH dehydrogenase [ubiquinone] 1 alpha subcomplex subunit 3-like [Protobothrops mucrosquamatus]|uniref:NADH dehydrogenase [ubiquinone] 1 alpha subcomplex subunit 3-like n=1 Tax=Protobothrops mucrosquamatus TaxID=103944 RepID=UPI000775C3F9|nr:NADH dehydrogenase [ubiquinone] 1 alpha subcomplex subunit 3-like [Protobothrops mucrosquamatus]
MKQNGYSEGIRKVAKAPEQKYENMWSDWAVTLPWVSPYAHYSTLMNENMPYHYPVPVRDDGNMPDIPAHPCDKEGERLEWLKK